MLFPRFPKLLAVVFVLFAVSQQPTLAIKRSYIVYLGGHDHGPDVSDAELDRVTVSHTQLLSSFVGSVEKAKDAIFYSYKRYINGFAAILDEEEAKEIARHPDVLSVFPDEPLQLQTTHSWEFLRLETNGAASAAWTNAKFGEDVIIGNIDTGVWPESKSFNGDGYGPIPPRWKGICQSANDTKNFCNSKLIGARYFNKGYIASDPNKPVDASYFTPRDPVGHGSHTLSTAAGNFVPGASVFGVGIGTAKGGSPRARAAAYKACWNKYGCSNADILEAFEFAIQDRVDVISISIGGGPNPILGDPLAIGSFHAVKQGITVVTSAGNSGPNPATVGNVSPWLITVAASTMDRQLEANVQLKNGSFFRGASLSAPLPTKGYYPLIYAADAKSAAASEADAKLCKQGTLDNQKVKGKILVCNIGAIDSVEKGLEASRAGAAGMIVISGNIYTPAYAHVLPATLISASDGVILLAYIKSTKNPEGLLTPPQGVVNIKPAPRMAGFSSGGPNKITKEVLKPDITAPGVEIIAAFSEAVNVTGLPWDKRTIPYTFLSGTSMSCPHVSGVVGIIKSIHRDWSPSAIKSAIMTTAEVRDNTGGALLDSDGSKANPFSYGSGHIRPNRAVDPGLVYDMPYKDYLAFLCGIGYDQATVRQFSGNKNYICPGKEYSLLNFNYPAISVPISAVKATGTARAARNLKNVGPPGTYKSRVRNPLGYAVKVVPEVLTFQAGQEQRFELIITTAPPSQADSTSFGELVWSDGTHSVRSPIVILP